MDFHVFTTHSKDGNDESPLQLISAALLAHYRRCEAELAVLKASATTAPETVNPPHNT